MGLPVDDALRKLMKRAKKGTISAVVSKPGGGTVTGDIADPSALIRPGERDPALTQTMGAMGAAVTAGAQQSKAIEALGPKTAQGQPMAIQPPHIQEIYARAERYKLQAAAQKEVGYADPEAVAAATQGLQERAAGELATKTAGIQDAAAQLYGRAYGEGDLQFDAPDLRTPQEQKKAADLQEAKALQPSKLTKAVQIRTDPEKAAAVKARIDEEQADLATRRYARQEEAARAKGGEEAVKALRRRMKHRMEEIPDPTTERHGMLGAIARTSQMAREAAERADEAERKADMAVFREKEAYKSGMRTAEAIATAKRRAVAEGKKPKTTPKIMQRDADDTIWGWVDREGNVQRKGYVGQLQGKLGRVPTATERQANLVTRLKRFIKRQQHLGHSDVDILNGIGASVNSRDSDIVIADFEAVKGKLGLKLDEAKPGAELTGDEIQKAPSAKKPPPEKGDEQELYTGDASEADVTMGTPSMPQKKKPTVPETRQEAAEADAVAGTLNDLREGLESRLVGADEARARLEQHVAELIAGEQHEAAEALETEGAKVIEELALDPDVEALLGSNIEVLSDPDSDITDLVKDIASILPDATQRQSFMEAAQKVRAARLREKAEKDPENLAKIDVVKETGMKFPPKGGTLNEQQVDALFDFAKDDEEMVRRIIAANEWDMGVK